jgi:hypothetical protein
MSFQLHTGTGIASRARTSPLSLKKHWMNGTIGKMVNSLRESEMAPKGNQLYIRMTWRKRELEEDPSEDEDEDGEDKNGKDEENGKDENGEDEGGEDEDEDEDEEDNSSNNNGADSVHNGADKRAAYENGKEGEHGGERSMGGDRDISGGNLPEDLVGSGADEERPQDPDTETIEMPVRTSPNRINGAKRGRGDLSSDELLKEQRKSY